MNVYMIREDGQDKLWKAQTMREAVQLAEEAYVKEEAEASTGEGEEANWREFYHETLLESCTLIGELANP